MQFFKKALRITLIFSLFIIFLPAPTSASSSDLNHNNIEDSTEASVIVTEYSTLLAGEYTFNNLTINPNTRLDLKGDPNSPNTFKGVKITAKNFKISIGSILHSDIQGYGAGPGTSPLPEGEANPGSSYGGKGGGDSMPVYGDSIKPTDLGSGWSTQHKGGGAVWIEVSETFTHNGEITANGTSSSTGGSIYINTKDIKGNGIMNANGGPAYCPISCIRSVGGGGRIAVHYNTSIFTGKANAIKQCYNTNNCTEGEDGTVGFFDKTNNNLYIKSTWKFEKSKSPFTFNNIYISNGANVLSDNGVKINANSINLTGRSYFTLGKNQILNIPNITIDNSTLTLSGQETITSNSLILKNNSTLTVLPEKILNLDIPNITIEQSRISADEKGYINGPGTTTDAGSSYGGVGRGNTPTSVYGNPLAPTDFGSGTDNRRGGGAIRITFSNSLINNGAISSNGTNGTSGGSIYITEKNNPQGTGISGTGVYRANGGQAQNSGGGGRVSINYQNNFTGITQAKGGCMPVGCGGNGTINKTKIEACTTDCFSNVMFFPGVMGTRMYGQLKPVGCNDPSCYSDNELWVSSSDEDQSKLSLNALGKSMNNLYTKNDTKNNGEMDETGIVDDSYSFNIYQSFIYDLRDWKTEGTINDYQFIPYDWRLSLDDIISKGFASTTDDKLFYNRIQSFSESFILKKLKELQANSKTGKVTLIGHSNGGLVIKALIQKLKDTNDPLYNKIDKVIFVAVPQVGTPEGFVRLLHGKSMAGGFVMTAKRNRQLAENMLTTYNLLPSANYFSISDPVLAVNKIITFESKPFFINQTSKYGAEINTPTELKDYLLGGDGRIKPSFNDLKNPNKGNSILYPQGEATHQMLDSWQPSSNTKVIQVAGWGEETIAGLDYISIMKSDGTEVLANKPRMTVEGDETVVTSSALWMDTSNPNTERWWVDLPLYKKDISNKGRVHKDIMEVLNLRNFIKSRIKNIQFTDSENVVVNHYPVLALAEDNRIHYNLYDTGFMGVRDVQGRYTSKDLVTGQVKEEIPSTRYMEIGETKWLSIPYNVAHTLEISGGKGDVVLGVDKKIGNTIIESKIIYSKLEKISDKAVLSIGSSVDLSKIEFNRLEKAKIVKTRKVADVKSIE